MSDTTIVGSNTLRVDAVAKVKGEARYPGDIVMDRMCHMKILFARRPHAIVKAIDTSKAEQAPGVIAVFTAKDVPNNEYGLGVFDQPVLCGPGSNKAVGRSSALRRRSSRVDRRRDRKTSRTRA